MSGISKKPRILVAEDDALLRLVAVEFLEDEDYAVVEAVDGEAALEILKSDPEIQLLVSDIRMPKMNGYKLVEAGLALRPDLKVLLMTGYTHDPVPAELTSRGIPIIYKPFDEKKFVEMARQTISSGQ